MRALVPFGFGFVVARVAIVVTLLMIGLLLAGGGHHAGPSPSALQHELARREAVVQQRWEEESRQAEYAKPGAPAPTANWQP